MSQRIKTIGDSAFSDCNALNSITLSDSVTSIGKWAFSSCSALSSITFGKGLETIESKAFEGCSKLTEVKISNIESWCKTTFEPDNLVSSTESFTSNPLYYVHHLYLLDGQRITDITLNNTISKVGNAALAYCTGLKSIKISDSIKEIGKSAFMGCTNLSYIDLGTGLQEIDDNAFGGCISLTEITIPASLQTMNFDGCKNLKTIFFCDGIEGIPALCFNSLEHIESVYIPKSVKWIAPRAFVDSEQTIQVFYAGTIAEWYMIDLEDFHGVRCNFNVIHCSDGNISK